MRWMMICAALIVLAASMGGCAGRRPATAEERFQIAGALAKYHGTGFLVDPEIWLKAPPATASSATRPTTDMWLYRSLMLGEVRVGQRDTLANNTILTLAAQNPGGQAILVREGDKWIVVKDRGRLR